MNLYWSGTSHKILMVISPWYRNMLQPRGLVPIWLILRCQFPGEWSQWIANFTSECDSPTHLSARRWSIICYTIFSVSLRTWIATLRIQGWLRCKKVREMFPGCVSIFSLRAICQFPFVFSQWLLWRKVTNCKCGSSFVYNYESSELLYSVGLQVALYDAYRF